MSHLSKKLQELNTQQLSNRRIADRATQLGHAIHHATVARYMRGEHPNPPKIEALEAIAKGLGVPLSLLEEAAARPFTGEPFKLPRRADALTESERAVIISMIDALIDAKTPAPSPAADFHPERAGYDLAAHHDDEARARLDWLEGLGEESQDS